MLFIKNSFARLYVGLSLCLLAAFFFLAYPAYVIRPFRPQGQRELATALTILQIRPALQVVLAILVLVFAGLLWRRSTTVLSRMLSSFMAVLTIAFGVLSHINIYEKMFHPLDRPLFAAASKSKLGPSEQVIAVKIAGSARAYPIRVTSYHHIVNDVLAGLPIVVLNALPHRSGVSTNCRRSAA